MKLPVLLKLALIGAALLLFFSFAASAALSIRDLDSNWTNGNEAVYDNMRDITWLADAVMTRSSGATSKTRTFHLNFL